MIELANEVCFPVGEATISGFLYSFAHVIGFLLGGVFSLILDSFSEKDKKKGTMWAIMVFVVIFVITLFFVFFMK